VIGRSDELAAVDAFLDALVEGPAALVFSGEPGIGKSTVWRAGVAAASSRSFRVLLCRPAETEAGLSFVSLADLLDGVSEDVLASLPGPQHAALDVALRRVGAPDQPDRVALARGAHAVVCSLAATAPIVVAIDDVQWLDAPSRDALRFVFRRLVGAQRVGLLATMRGDDAPLPLAVDAALPLERITRVVLRAFGLRELERVVRSHIELSLPAPSWRAIHRVSGGNPFFALQIAEAVALKGGLAPGEDPPLPPTVTAAVCERLRSLSTAARRTLLYAATLGRPSAALLDSMPAGGAGLDQALAARVLEPEGDGLRFAHPLLAAFVYAEASRVERRQAHRVLADIVRDPEERALHLARGSDTPDETVAARLEAAADAAARRGVPETAAELAEHAERLTPAARVEDAARRAIQAARYCGRAGDTARGMEILQRLGANLPPGRLRARALALLGFIAQDGTTLRRAVDEAAGNDELLGVAHADLSTIELRHGDRSACVDHARAAVEAARASCDTAALAKALTAQALPLAYGHAEQALPLLDEALELERTLKEPLSLINSPTTWRGAVLLNADRLAEARAALEDAYHAGLALGHASRALPLTYLVELECREGNCDRALAYALEADAIGRGWARGQGVALTLVARVLVEADVGDVDTARADGMRSIELTRARDVITLARTEAALGRLELSVGNFGPALDRLDALAALPGGEPLRDAPAFRGAADAVEALVGLGRTHEADQLARRLERRASNVGLPSWLAATARCRALVLAQLGDTPAARAAISEAQAVHARHHEPLEHARTLLVAGVIERRARKKAEAREALEQARTIFEQLGARAWCERASRELDRAGIRRIVSGELTAAERRVAELAASGATNKEIAAELFMSVKTVEAHLSRVYRKLRVRSRTELSSRISPTAA
jgi:DNA-binding CsgD family transcriptional regulator